MVFNKHSDLEGSHAFLSASKYHWINYDEEKLAQSYLNFLANLRANKTAEVSLPYTTTCPFLFDFILDKL